MKHIQSLSWETQKGLSPDHHRAGSLTRARPAEEGVVECRAIHQHHSETRRAEACDKSSTEVESQATPSRRHPRCAQAYPHRH